MSIMKPWTPKYPKEIWLNWHPEVDEHNDISFCSWDDEHYSDKQVGYTRSDLIPKWHKYPNEKPTKTALYIVTRAANMGEYQVWVTSEYYNAKSEMWIENGLDDISNQILAWMELPEPYEE